MPAPTGSGPELERFAVRLNSFGEATSLPVRIRKAAFQVFPAPTINQNLIQLELTVVNDRLERDIAAKLNVPLPTGATVCKFEFLRHGEWYPAVPVEAKAAREVVYKEKEKGHAVGAISQKQGNVFEIEISPLGYNAPAQCRLWYNHLEANLPFDFDPDTEVDVNVDMQPGREPGAGAPAGTGACVIGDCFGQRHFACFVPYAKPADEVFAAAPKRIALLWDTSGSQEGDHKLRFDRLRELANHCPQTTFDVWTFGINFRRAFVSVGVEEAIAMLSSVQYDGGSDLTVLPLVLAAVSPADAVLLFSDGMDSLDRQPSLLEPSPPVHCIVDQAKVSLRTLSTVSLSTGGRLLRGGYTQILRPQVLLARIGTDQEDEAFFDPNDAFTCCPDHRLHLQWPVGEEGLWLCGTAGAVQRLTAELSVGGQKMAYNFDFAAAPVLTTGAAPLLGYLYAQQQYSSVERDGAAMGIDLGKIRAELALRYGFCSPEASLLMLYSAEQFIEHQLDCPKHHPTYSVWERRRGTSAIPDPRGGLGQLKTEDQMRQVAKLAQQLRRYMKDPIPEELLAMEGARHARRNGSEAWGASRDGYAPMMASAAPRRAREGCALMMRAAAPRLSPMMRPAASPCLAAAAPRLSESGAGACAAVPPRSELRLARCAAPATAFDGAPWGDDAMEIEVGCGAESLRGSMAAGFRAAEGATMEAEEVEARAAANIVRGGGESVRGCKGSGRGGKGTGKGRRGDDRGHGSSLDSARETQDCREYVQGKEQDYLKTLGDALKRGAWQQVYAELRHGNATSPSFFLYAAGLVLEHDVQAACRICTNCLEINIQDVQMMRSVGYFLVKAGRTSFGLAVLDRVRELAPIEPQSFLDSALARAVDLFGGHFCEQTLREAVRLAAVVVNHAWADRFSEVEWPALVLLHMLLEVGQRQGLGDSWPESLSAELRCPEFGAGLVVWLGWDTDKTDIDLHVVEPSGNEVYYSNKRSVIGGHLSKDFTEGYGPEVYLLKDPPAGSYRIRAKYYASHQASSLTGATSAVIWALRGGERPELKFNTVRLDRNKEMMDVMTVAVDGETAVVEFIDAEGDVVRLAREGAKVNKYVNGKLEMEGLRGFHVDATARSYERDSGSGSFRPEEDLGRFRRLVYQLFAKARQGAVAWEGRVPS